MERRLAELKIEALLHDPPGKVPTLWYRSHEAFAADLVRLMLGREPQHEALVKTADQYASAVDRTGLARDPVSYRVDFLRDPEIVHPLSGARYLLGRMSELDLSRIEDDQRSAVEAIVREAGGPGQDADRLYWHLWRGLGDALEARGEIGKLWTYLPADTRNPDHSIWDHMALTSAFAGALPKPALVLFSFGPVQSLISAARRTGDLWAGSFLLSWLAWSGMKELVAEWGGDAILFPHLRGQPLLDRWLREERGWPDIPGLKKSSRVASLPNRFLALLPADAAEGLAKRCEVDLREAAHSFAASHVEDFQREYCGSRTHQEWLRRSSEEVANTIYCHWYVLPWIDESDGLRELSEKVLGDQIDYFWKTLKALLPAAAYRPNRGTYFAVESGLAELGHGAVKVCRRFAQFAEQEKARRCTVCGLGGALWDPRRDDTLRAGRALKEGEALCGLCAARRRAPRSRWAQELTGDTVQFPSTHNLAAARFLEEVLGRLVCLGSSGAESADRKLTDSLERFVDALGNVDLAYATRLLFQQAGRCGTHAEIAERLVKLPAELLAPETYRDPEALEELGFQGDAALPARALAAFLKGCRDSAIEPPGSYYAVLLMDGDRMGQWLSGDLAPTIGEVVHGGARPTGDPGYLDRRRPLSSAHQVAVSRALNEFSLEIVPSVVEDLHGGVVVYGGGDDLLALLPLHRLLPCLGDLRRLYSGLPLPDGSLAKDRGYESRSGYVKKGGRLWRVMGEKATCSMGVVIAHQKWPLRHALETARRMEKDVAKDRLGRNAAAIALLKRSGSHEVFGSKWGHDRGVSDPDPMANLQGIISLIADRRISRRFAYSLQEEVRAVWTLPESLEERTYWLIARHWRRSEHQFDHKRALEVAKRLRELSEQLKAQWSESPGEEDRGGNEAQKGFIAGLGLAEFIARDIRGSAS